jgi:fructose/tagatose bisphosphate aldolase
LEGVDAVVSAAEEEQSPAILQVRSTLQALSPEGSCMRKFLKYKIIPMLSLTHLSLWDSLFMKKLLNIMKSQVKILKFLRITT